MRSDNRCCAAQGATIYSVFCRGIFYPQRDAVRQREIMQTARPAWVGSGRTASVHGRRTAGSVHVRAIRRATVSENGGSSSRQDSRGLGLDAVHAEIHWETCLIALCGRVLLFVPPRSNAFETTICHF
jgi:hypothetical protein